MQSALKHLWEKDYFVCIFKIIEMGLVLKTLNNVFYLKFCKVLTYGNGGAGKQFYKGWFSS